MPLKHDQIASSLVEDILKGRYQPGDRLPSERDLATRFEANRGAVREAMKTLAQMGLANVQPGGARVNPREEASLDVIGHLLSQGAGASALPDAVLVDQILVVISSLVSVAAEQTLELATSEELEEIRSTVRRLHEETLDRETHTMVRIELMHRIMQASQNLPLQLIARTLIDQFVPHMAAIHDFVQIDQEAYATFARQLDLAMHRKDQPALHAAFTAFSKLNRETMLHAFEAARGELSEPIAGQLPS